MKRFLSVLMTLTIVFSAVATPTAGAQEFNLEDLLIVGVTALFAGFIISEALDDDAQIGVHIDFNQDGRRGYHHYVGEGYFRGERGRLCREFETIYVDECGRPIPGMISTRVECKNRRGRWQEVDYRDYRSSRQFHGERPHLNRCAMPIERDPMVIDEPWTNDPDIDFWEEEQAPGIVPMNPGGGAPTIIPMEQPPGIVPMNPNFQFAPQTIN